MKSSAERLGQLRHIEPIPAPREMPALYVLSRPYDVSEEGAYTLPGSGTRLCNLSTTLPEDVQRDLAYNGYNYGYRNFDDARQSYLGSASGWGDSVVHKVDLKYANDIYVVDESALLKAREAVFAKIEEQGRDRMTDQELNSTYIPIARTIVGLKDYSGGYEKPVYLIGRPLASDEAKYLGREKDLKVVKEQTVVASGEKLEL